VEVLLITNTDGKTTMMSMCES